MIYLAILIAIAFIVALCFVGDDKRLIKYAYPMLYARIQELCTQNNTEKGFWESEFSITECRAIESLFLWHSTKEGHEFWKYIYRGDFKQAKCLQPQLFESVKLKDRVHF